MYHTEDGKVVFAPTPAEMRARARKFLAEDLAEESRIKAMADKAAELWIEDLRRRRNPPTEEQLQAFGHELACLIADQLLINQGLVLPADLSAPSGAYTELQKAGVAAGIEPESIMCCIRMSVRGDDGIIRITSGSSQPWITYKLRSDGTWQKPR